MTTIPEGYQEFWVKEEVERQYKCPICHLVMKNVVQTFCGHKYCEECLFEHMKQRLKCPICSELLDKKKIFFDKCTTDQISALMVYCQKSEDEGCTWKGRLDKLNEHMKNECPFEWIDCPNKCGQFMYRHQFPQHDEDVCPNRKAICPYCSTDFQHFQLQKHFITCSMFPINCDFCHTPEQIPRMKRENHYKRECPMYPLDCPFATLGCKFRDIRKKMDEHVQNEFLNHMYDLGEHFTKNENTHSQDFISTSAVSSGIQDLIFRNLSVKKKEIEDSIRGLMCNGKFIWKIENFQSKREQARDGEVQQMYSPPFYSSPHGYKFCLRLHPYGISDYPGSLSLFLQIMKGEYDDAIKWPFQGRIIFTLIDQSSEKRKHIEETCYAPSNFLFSQRAINERNPKGFGYSSFASPNQLEANPNFTKNDTLMIKCTVVI